MKKIISVLAFGLLAFGTTAQNTVEEILQLVEKHNTTLRAAADRTATAKQEVMMENALEGPEVGFNYLNGNHAAMGKRRDFSVNQSFDLATVFGYRHRLAKSQKESLDLQYQQLTLETRLEAIDLLVQLTYYNQALAVFNERLVQERQLATSYEKRLAAGDANKIEVNRARLSLANVETETSRFTAERDLLLIQLKTICGGAEVDYQGTDYQVFNISNPMSLRSMQETQNAQQQLIARNELRSARSQSMPSITAGYMAELTDDEKWRGVTVGLSIPLWRNVRNVKRARLQVQSAQSEAEDAMYQLEQIAAAQKLRTERYFDIAQDIKNKLANASSYPLLRKALAEGEISLVEYTIEVSDLFDMRIKALEAERDYQQARIYYSALGE